MTVHWLFFKLKLQHENHYTAENQEITITLPVN